MHYIQAGNGFTIGNDFSRAKTDMPIELAPKEYAKPGHVIGYIQGDPSAPMFFMRAKRIRVHVRNDAIIDRVPA